MTIEKQPESLPSLHPPRGLNARERLTLDAIRYSWQMVGLSYERLRAEGAEYSRLDLSDTTQSDELRTAIFADAWSTIDIINRLRVLIRTYPMVAARELLDVRTFIKRSETVQTVRDRFQHLSEQLTRRIELEAASEPVFGQISWIYVEHPDDLSKPMFLYGVSGGGAPQNSNLQQSVKASRVGGSRVEIPAGRFELHAFGRVVRLSEQMENLRTCVLALDQCLRSSFAARAAAAAKEDTRVVQRLLEPILECSGFRLELRVDGSGAISADQDIEAVTSLRTPQISF